MTGAVPARSGGVQVAATHGSRAMVTGYSFAAALLIAAYLAVVLNGGVAAVANRIGVTVGAQHVSTVVAREFVLGSFGGRFGSSICDRMRYTVAWPDGGGTVDVCTATEPTPLDPGATLAVREIWPITDLKTEQQLADYEPAAWIALLLPIIAGWCVVRAVRSYRLRTAGAPVYVAAGTLHESPNGFAVLQPESTAADLRPWTVLFARGATAMRAGEHATLMASRRSRITGGPVGPFALARSSGAHAVILARRHRRAE